MPEPGERAEPIAMGRQTIWGGAGKPPSRDVMQAAAKTARSEMMQRVRESKGAQGERGGNTGGGGRGGQRSGGQRSHSPAGDHAARAPSQRPAPGRGGNGGGYGGYGGGNAPVRAAQGQPDPMRTSVDMMAERGARRGGGGFGGGNRNGGSYGGGGSGSRGPGSSRGSFNR